MWIITNRGLLTVTENKINADEVIVRSRQRGLLEEVMEGVIALDGYGVEEDSGADFPFRVSMHRAQFGGLLLAEAERVDYRDFEKSINDPVFASLLSKVSGLLGALRGGLRPDLWEKSL